MARLQSLDIHIKKGGFLKMKILLDFEILFIKVCIER